MAAVWNFFLAGNIYVNDVVFYQYVLSGFQEDELQNVDDTECLAAFGEYSDIFHDTRELTASQVYYLTGRENKGNGTGSSAGYWIFVISAWMDVIVSLTDLWERCAIDYFLQALGRGVQSLSGALDLVTNFMFRLFDNGEV